MASQPVSPVEPIKKRPPHIQPNAHPYAIKTTSSALLSRSNSSPHSAHHTRHHYVPSRLATGTRVRHRHSSSLSSVDVLRNVGVCVNPAPLPTPRPFVAASLDDVLTSPKPADEPKSSHRVTMPSSATESITGNQESGSGMYAGLPPNPKQWDTDEVTTYLETSFKGNGINGDKDDTNLVDILDCVRACGLTGRELLRLTDADLAGTPLSDVQRAQLLERSRTLRADLLRGRIYVDSYHSHEVSHNSHNTYSQSVHSPQFYSIYGGSVSADDVHLLLDNNTKDGQSVLLPSPVLPLPRSNSVSDTSAQRYRDLARMRTRHRGRVKGLIESWERTSTSGSEGSASEAESESESESISDAKHEPEPEPPSALPAALHDVPPQSVCSSVDSSAVVPRNASPSTPPPLYAHINNTPDDMGDEEEPSIEELLASSSDIPLKGGRAWEADFGLGDTVKHISVSGSTDAGSPFPSVTEQDTYRSKDDSQQARTKGDSVRSKGLGMRRGSGSRGKNTETQKRVVTAIFTGIPSEDLSESLGDEVHLGHYRHTSCLHEVPSSSNLQDDSDNVLRALEESIAVTRAQLEVFRLRLEEVEADTARYEAMLMRAQCSDTCQPSDYELRQRRSEASEKAVGGTTELPRDESFIEGARNKDLLEGWETMSLADIARAIVARAVGWLFPHDHLGVYTPEARSDSRSGANDECRPSVEGNNRFPVARMSCNIILVSFAVCAVLLRRMGFGRWVPRP